MPAFSGSTTSGAQRPVDTNANATISHKVSLNVSYTLDLWQRLANAADAAEWLYKATAEDMEVARLNYEQRITTALNNVDTNYFAFSQAQTTLSNLQQTHSYNQRITQYYPNRYNAGVSELREWLVGCYQYGKILTTPYFEREISSSAK